MVEPPSRQLTDILQQTRLCTPRDLRRCRGLVRRLARDVPVFDSLWIDALVQARRITPFQAQQLESGKAGKLAVGPCILLEQFGQGLCSATYLAKHRDRNERLVLKFIDLPHEFLGAARSELEQLCAKLAGGAHPSVVGPQSSLVIESDNQLVTVSRLVPGLHLGELLVRRGRFPASVVHEIARQVIDGLAAMEKRGVVHGDILLKNIRITTAGAAVLVDCGIRPAVLPELTIHARLSPDRYDGAAPELVGTGRLADSRSDLYALGCLLWQLLAGRPPFPTGDPLAKLAAHQTRRIADVRRWAPDTPDWLAEQILRWTSPDPEQRPSSFREVREVWGPPRRAGFRRLARFRAAFDSAAPRIPNVESPHSSGRWPFFVLLLFVLTGATLTLLDQGARNHLVALGNQWSTALREATEDRIAESHETQTESARPLATDALRPLPGPNAEGVILLDSVGPYAAARVDAVGLLTIRGQLGVTPQIVVADQPLEVVAGQVALENIHVRRAATDGLSDPLADDLRALTLVQSQNLVIRQCSFQSHDAALVEATLLAAAPTADATALAKIAVAWRPINAAATSGGTIELEDVSTVGLGAQLYVGELPQSIRAANCLKLGPGPLLDVGHVTATTKDMRVDLSHCTLRGASSILDRRLVNEQIELGHTVVEAVDCVVALHGADAALFRWSGPRPHPEAATSVELTGEGSLTLPDLIVGRMISTADNTTTEVDTTAMIVEGLAASPFEFAGPPGLEAAASTVSDYSNSSRSSTPPGIVADTLIIPQPTINIGTADSGTLAR